MTDELERELSNLKQGAHLCPIYESVAEQTASALVFMKAGLARGERCLYIADDRTVEQVVQTLAAAGVDVERETQQGALQILTRQESYLPSPEFDPQVMLDFLRQAEAGAIADGRSGLRVTGEMTWALQPGVDSDRLIEYEALLNQMLPASGTVMLCQYNRTRFDPAVIHRILQTHPVVILGEQVCPNPFYEPPELILGEKIQPSSDLMTRRVDWWIKQLKQARAAAREREQLLERLHTLSRRLLEVQEAERRHLARELHDEVGQMLTGLGLLLKSTGDLFIKEVQSRLEEARVLVDGLIERIRGLSFDLRPAALDQFGLLPALRLLFERYTSQTGIRINLQQTGVEGRFPPEVETTAYRIVQEALTNVARHAGVTEAEVRLWVDGNALKVQVEDQGVGFDPEAVLAEARSSGLPGMHERGTLLGGRLIIESTPGSGTHLMAELPLAGPGGRQVP